jgi:hypothetical protein
MSINDLVFLHPKLKPNSSPFKCELNLVNHLYWPEYDKMTLNSQVAEGITTSAALFLDHLLCGKQAAMSWNAKPLCEKGGWHREELSPHREEQPWEYTWEQPLWDCGLQQVTSQDHPT